MKRSFTLPSALNLTATEDLVEAGKVTPHITLPFADIKQALALSETGRARGKIVLNIGGSKGSHCNVTRVCHNQDGRQWSVKSSFDGLRYMAC